MEHNDDFDNQQWKSRRCTRACIIIALTVFAASVALAGCTANMHAGLPGSEDQSAQDPPEPAVGTEWADSAEPPSLPTDGGASQEQEVNSGPPDSGGDPIGVDAATMEPAPGGGELDGGERGGSVPVWVGVGPWGYRTSTEDGLSWAVTANPSTGDDHSPDLLRDVAFGDGVFIAVGGDRNAMIMRSTDGSTWQEDLYPAGEQWKGGVAYGAGRWVAVGGVGSTAYSDDGGLSWSEGGRLPQAGRDVAWGNGHFVAIGDDGMIAISTDGFTWTDATVSPEIRLGSVAYGHGMWIAIGSQWNGGGFDTACFQSVDETRTWSGCPFEAGRFDSVALTNGQLLVIHDQGFEATTNGSSWAHGDSLLPANVYFADGLWVGLDGDRRYQGTQLDALAEEPQADRGARAFVQGWRAATN